MKNKWILNLVIALVSFALVSCGGGDSDNSTVQQQPPGPNQPIATSHELVLNIEQDESRSGFVISCPSNVNCNDATSTADDETDSDDETKSHDDNELITENDDETSDSSISNFNYRDYKFENDDVYLYLSLDSAIIDNYSVAAFKENFNYFNFQIFFPDKETATSMFYFTNKTPVQALGEQTTDGLKFTIIDFVDNKLQGKIEGTIKTMTEHTESDDPDCVTNDVQGICFKSETVDIPFTVNFNLTVE